LPVLKDQELMHYTRVLNWFFLNTCVREMGRERTGQTLAAVMPITMPSRMAPDTTAARECRRGTDRTASGIGSLGLQGSLPSKIKRRKRANSELSECLAEEEREVLQEAAELSGELTQRTTSEALRDDTYYIGLDIHKKTISYSLCYW
jgi:hypothetical protein